MRVARSTDKFFYIKHIDFANRLLKHLYHYFYKTVTSLDSHADKTKKYMAHA